MAAASIKMANPAMGESLRFCYGEVTPMHPSSLNPRSFPHGHTAPR